MKILKTLLLALIFVCLPMLSVFSEESQKAEEAKVTGSGALGVYNRYVFRGYEIGKSGLVMQPSLTGSYKGFSASFWGNIDTNQRSTKTADFSSESADHKKGWNETDLTLSYTYPIGKLSLTGGYIYYNTKYALETEEVFATASLDVIGKPSLSIYRDIANYPGTYLNLAFAHSFPLVKEMTLDLGASFGYFIGAENYWKTYETSTGAYTGGKYKGLHDGMVKAGLTVPVTKSLVIQPVVQYWFPLSSKVKKEYANGTDTDDSYNPNGPVKRNFVYGVGLTYSF